MPKRFSKFDMALILVVLPYILQIKLALFSFLIFALALMVFKIKPNKFFLTIFTFLGFILVWVLYVEPIKHKFIGLDAILTFLGMLFLVLMVTFRLHGKINVYLILSTFLVLIFSLHYYEAVYTMTYCVFCIYSFLVLYLWHKQKQDLKESISYANKMMLFSLPFVFILFILSPKFDFKSYATSKMKSSRSASGFEGTLSLKNVQALTPSSKKAFELWFESDVPKETNFYFRGSVLYTNKGGFWEAKLNSNYEGKVKTENKFKPIRYSINIFPNGRKWLYSLDYLVKAPDESIQYKDGTLLKNSNINEDYKYTLISKLNSNTLEKNETKNSLLLDYSIAPKLYEEIKHLKLIKNPQERVDHLIEYLSSKKLTYTLDVNRLTKSSPIDEFLFETKEGYCVHFASLFATATQLINIPSRIVTGYLTSKEEQIKNYIFAREKNAHAWVEIYLENKGWIRFEATKLAKGNINLYPKAEGLAYYMEEISLHYRYYLRSLLETLVYYADLLELDFLIEVIEESGTILKSFLGFFFLAILTYLSINIFSPKKRNHEKELNKLLKLLAKHNYIRLNTESIEAFINRVAKEENSRIKEILFEINEHYHDWVYGEKQEAKQAFIKSQKKLQKSWS